MQSEQAAHDRVNLARLVRRLEKTIAAETWVDEPADSSTPAWIRTRGTLQVRSKSIHSLHVYSVLVQKVKHARKLLQTVESYEDAAPDS